MTLIEHLLSTDPNMLVTGQLFFRLISLNHNVGSYQLKETHLKENLIQRDLFSVIGNIAVPRGLLNGNHQYPIAGKDMQKLGGLVIGLDQHEGIDFKEQFNGFGLGQILKEPIWRI